MQFVFDPTSVPIKRTISVISAEKVGDQEIPLVPTPEGTECKKQSHASPADIPSVDVPEHKYKGCL